MVDLSLLNDEQRSAVLDFDHNLLILACAGSGKTRTITTKIAYAISEGIFKPYQILAVTFTNRAAGEMRERVAAMLPDVDLDGLEMRTFHSFGAYILRRYGERAGLSPSFCIYDDDDSLSLLSTVVTTLDKRNLREIQKAISNAKDRGLDPDSPGLESMLPDYDFRTAFRRYEEALAISGNADFADLICKSTQLLRDDKDVAGYFQKRFRMVLVDEYQDSNRMQFEMLRSLVGPDTLLVTVGDDDQSIYSFRGAEIENILTFASSFENVREIKLEKNYRSTSQILSAAAALISHNKARHKKDLVSAYGTSGAKPSVMFSTTGTGEGERVADLIRNLGGYDDTAILYRTNAQSQIFERALTDRRIPYKVIGALKFYEREEVKDSLAFLYLLMNHRDQVSFRRIINKPSRGIGNAKLMQILGESEDLMEALRAFAAKAPKSAREGAEAFLSAWERAEQNLADGMPLGDILNAALLDTGLYDLYNSEPDRAVRLTKTENLGELVSVLQQAGCGREALTLFLEKLTLDNTVLGDDDPGQESGVTLMTMHNTKGLEFDRVFIAGAEDEIIPGRHEESLAATEEERRIMYVAMTRARKSLYISYAAQRMMWGHTDYHTPSRFLKDIPGELLAGEVGALSQPRFSRSLSSHVGDTLRYKPRTALSSEPAWTPGNVVVRKKKPASQAPAVHFEVGDKVRSDNFGSGVVRSIEKAGVNRIITVRFNNSEAKFVEGSAKLEKL